MEEHEKYNGEDEKVELSGGDCSSPVVFSSHETTAPIGKQDCSAILVPICFALQIVCSMSDT